jgi:hypothetical protein
MPASTGLGGTTTQAVCVQIVERRSNTNLWLKSVSSNRLTTFGNPVRVSQTSGVYGAVDPTAYTFSILDSFWPPNSKAAYVYFEPDGGIQLTTAGIVLVLSVTATAVVYEDNTNANAAATIAFDNEIVTKPSANSIVNTFAFGAARIPTPQVFPGALPSPRRLDLHVTGFPGPNVIPQGTCLMRILGFEY